jgi:hypothetical protein
MANATTRGAGFQKEALPLTALLILQGPKPQGRSPQTQEGSPEGLRRLCQRTVTSHGSWKVNDSEAARRRREENKSKAVSICTLLVHKQNPKKEKEKFQIL